MRNVYHSRVDRFSIYTWRNHYFSLRALYHFSIHCAKRKISKRLALLRVFHNIVETETRATKDDVSGRFCEPIYFFVLEIGLLLMVLPMKIVLVMIFLSAL